MNLSPRFGSSWPHLAADEAESPEAHHRQFQRGSQRQSALVGDDVDQSDVEMASLQRLKQVVVAQQVLPERGGGGGAMSEVTIRYGVSDGRYKSTGVIE